MTTQTAEDAARKPHYPAAKLRRRPLVGIDLVDGQPDRIAEVPDADRAAVARNLAHVEQRVVRSGGYAYVIAATAATNSYVSGFALPKGH